MFTCLISYKKDIYAKYHKKLNDFSDLSMSQNIFIIKIIIQTIKHMDSLLVKPINYYKKFLKLVQVACVCEILLASGKLDRLARFLWSLPAESQIKSNESVLKARCFLEFASGNFKKCFL